MIDEILSGVETPEGTLMFAMITIIVGISAIWAAVQAYKAALTFRRMMKGRSN